MCLPLPGAYRSLPRPSSPRDAKASVVRPYTLGRRSKPSPISLRCNSSSQTMQLSKIKPRPEAGKTVPVRRRPQGLVGVPGIEPGTSSLSGTRSNQLSYTPALPEPPARTRCGGGSRIRTGDIQLAKLALCQLSYAPGTGRLSRRALKRFRGPHRRGPEGVRADIQPVQAGLMCGASPPPPPRRAFHHRPASPPGCSLERR